MTNPLIERLQKAGEGSRELDAEIALAVGYHCQPDGYGEGDAWTTPEGRSLPSIGRMGARPPAFTTSIDAALSLVPEGWRVDELSESQRGRFWSMLRPREYKEGLFYVTDEGASFALAICIAALRAREDKHP